MIHKFLFTNKLDNTDVAIGILIAKNVHVSKTLPLLETKLKTLLERRKNEDLTPHEEKFREESRNMLRNGDFKPTGRNKPASEYLLRAVQEENFPRINTVVDINNFISLKYMVPISLWDLDQADCVHYMFRLGKDGEEYVFNSANQSIQLRDLVTGFTIQRNKDIPIINPIKDSLKTKTTTSTRNIGAAIYFPLQAGTKDDLRNIIREFSILLDGISENETEYDII